MIKVAEKKVNDDILKWREYSVTSAEIQACMCACPTWGYQGSENDPPEMIIAH
jgi:hypothetical protein